MVKFDVWRTDWVLISSVIIIIGLGLPFLNSAATSSDFNKQIVWLLIGIVVFVVCAVTDYKMWLKYAYLIYGLTIVLLLYVLTTTPINNARSYIRFSSFGIQPAEIAKLAVIMALAKYLASAERNNVKIIFPALVITIIPLALILIQPDLGTALTLPPLFLAMIFIAGVKIRYLFVMLMGGIASLIPLWQYVMKNYQKNRVLAFLYPEKYETAEAYQMLMSIAAIGSGGMVGQGIGKGVITDLDLLPEKHNDFIFGVISEEGGFMVAGTLVLLFLIVVLAGIHISSQTKNIAGKFLAVGVVTIIGWQTLLNMGVVTGILPTTGVTLPLISYGGSSMVVTLAMLGLLVSVGNTKHEFSYVVVKE